MSTARNFDSLSVEEYLAGELESDIKYEYVNGRVYAMAGGKNLHHRIASRALVALAVKLGDSECEAYNSDAKVRVQIQAKTYFYYPDAMVVCESNPDDDTYQDRPVVIVEVISESTRRIDEGEKADHYLSIPSLQAYVLLEQSVAAARVLQRNDNGQFEESVFTQPDSVITIDALDLQLPLREIYAGIAFATEPGSA
ncbi:Uma2 family endonuclease [Allorhodopirellula heiligendammensis]|uniref:Putative restriction endonuclease domain-containing protein n=1 Tax=Allorhodopirellula heiligendammensis TaxID=2714739 RepID=A0A5C6BYF2_9BACT|nr:Uma2 family endonuclease [Allorhodopirellula heiligendammensis]TWU16862.1 hypothetical protein Poly21_40690 [Allorhodopirellula heiligendammensis]